jgi:protein-S-isoprenylcysteine O-methyltransferase Ste14
VDTSWLCSGVAFHQLLKAMNSLARRTLLGFAQLIAGLAILLLAPAWTLDYRQAWVYLLIFAVSSALITLYLWKKDQKLLERRLKAGPVAEEETSQKLIQLLASVVFMGAMILPSLDHRFSWSMVPLRVVVIGDVLAALGFTIVFLVFRVNTFTASTIAVTIDQKVVSSGPYAVVRHPMYSGALVLLFGTPLALGSWWGLLMFIPMLFTIAWRTRDEERLLVKNLAGYRQYCQVVRYRLVSLLW